MKKLLPVIVVALIVIIGVVVGPKVIQTCDACDETFFGAGYEPGAVNEFFSGDELEVVCEDCAMEQHAVEIAFGKSLDEFKRDIF